LKNLDLSNNVGPVTLITGQTRLMIVEKSRPLTMSAGVKQFSRTLLQALIEERHFALADGLRIFNLGSL